MDSEEHYMAVVGHILEEVAKLNTILPGLKNHKTFWNRVDQ